MEDISAEIIEQAVNGDINAFEKIYKHTASFVYSIALRMTRNTFDAEEITQDVFLQIHRNLNKFQQRSALKTWIYRITINTAINVGKKNNKHVHNNIQFEDYMVETRDNGFTENENKKDNQKLLEKVFKYLNEDQKAVLILREIEDLDYSQIAETLNINLNTVRSRLKRAREKLMNLASQGVIKNEM